mmetsp:Transcript_10203/g.17514  ORF Transcript_10203/g.17514 Transcript_10203/m.17514 type:complete len:787 (-) Transcript_10203:1212-3572(-)
MEADTIITQQEQEQDQQPRQQLETIIDTSQFEDFENGKQQQHHQSDTHHHDDHHGDEQPTGLPHKNQTFARRGEEVYFRDLNYYIKLNRPATTPQQQQTGADGETQKSSRIRTWFDTTYKSITAKFMRAKNRGVPTLEELENPSSYKKALREVSGYARPGEILCVMGPSGGGKTTFLHTLAGRAVYGTSQGTVLFGGAPRTKATRRRIGYVLQDDVFFSNLTVRETLWFTARVKLPESMSLEEKKHRVESVIKRLGLTRCADTLIGNQNSKERISGGERKRTSIAVELLQDPSILLLDEPTSGLDSNTALTVIKLLKEIASEGKTVITTLHQPSSAMFAEFDKLLLFAEGSVVYFGPGRDAVEYFASIGFPCPYGYNPADFFLELLTDEDLNGGRPIKQTLKDEWKKREELLLKDDPIVWHEPRNVKSFRESLLDGKDKVKKAISGTVDSVHRKVTKSLESADESSTSSEPSDDPERALGEAAALDSHDLGDRKYASSWWTQFKCLCERSFKQKRGDHWNWVLVTQTVVITTLVGIIFFRMNDNETSVASRQGFIFFGIVFWGFTGMFSSLFSLPAERALINKDRASATYCMSAYFLSKTLMEIPIEIIYPTFYSIVTYWMCNLNPDFGRFVVFMVVMLVNFVAAMGMGIACAALTMDFRKAQTLATCIMLGSLLSSGFYVAQSQLPDWISWIQWTSFLQYANVALLMNEFNGQTYACVPGANTEYSYGGTQCPVTADQIYAVRGINSELGFGFYFGMLVLFLFVMRALGYVFLRFLHVRHKAKVH